MKIERSLFVKKEKQHKALIRVKKGKVKTRVNTMMLTRRIRRLSKRRKRLKKN